MWNFHRSWFFAMEFLRGATQLCEILYVFWNSTFRNRCLYMFKNHSLKHEMFCFVEIKSILNVLKQ